MEYGPWGPDKEPRRWKRMGKDSRRWGKGSSRDPRCPHVYPNRPHRQRPIWVSTEHLEMPSERHLPLSPVSPGGCQETGSPWPPGSDRWRLLLCPSKTRAAESKPTAGQRSVNSSREPSALSALVPAFLACGQGPRSGHLWPSMKMTVARWPGHGLCAC